MSPLDADLSSPYDGLTQDCQELQKFPRRLQPVLAVAAHQSKVVVLLPKSPDPHELAQAKRRAGRARRAAIPSEGPCSPSRSRRSSRRATMQVPKSASGNMQVRIIPYAVCKISRRRANDIASRHSYTLGSQAPWATLQSSVRMVCNRQSCTAKWVRCVSTRKKGYPGSTGGARRCSAHLASRAKQRLEYHFIGAQTSKFAACFIHYKFSPR